MRIRLPRTKHSLLAVLGLTLAAIAMPSSALAIMPGAESNGQLVNSTSTPDVQAKELDRMRDQGVKVVRVNFGWQEIAAGCAGRSTAVLGNHANGCYNWSILDSLVKLSTDRSIKVLLSTSRVPDWIHAGGCAAEKKADGDPFCYYMGKSQGEFNNTVKYYAAFMKAAGTRYKPGSANGTIPYWTIWNEPNSIYFWKPTPNAARYAQLYGAAAQALKAANPKAMVAPGPTGPKSTPLKPVPFIQAFQTNVVKFLPKKNPKRFINAWAHNPYPLGVTAPNKITVGSKKPNIGLANVKDLFTLLDSKPITKKLPVWGTEFGYESMPDETFSGMGVPRNVQAQYLAESFDLLDRTGRVTIGIWYGLTDGPLAKDPTGKYTMDWQSGTFTFAGEVKPSFTMYQRMVSVPMGQVKKGTTVDVWGRSNLSPGSGQLVYCQVLCGTNAAQWHPIPGTKKKSDGGRTARFRMMKPTYFSIFDGVTSVTDGYGMSRIVLAK